MESSETCRTEALKSFALSRSGIQGVKDVRIGRPDTPLESGGTWAVTGFRNEVARLARFSQCFSIRTTYPDSICYHPGVMFTNAVCFLFLLTSGWEKRTFRALTFYIRISHSRMGKEDASTSPDRHNQTF